MTAPLPTVVAPPIDLWARNALRCGPQWADESSPFSWRADRHQFSPELPSLLSLVCYRLPWGTE